jgi:hypothetical protein
MKTTVSNVNRNATVTVVAAAADNEIVTGKEVVFTGMVSKNNAGINTYNPIQIQISGIYVGSIVRDSSGSLSITNLKGDGVTYAGVIASNLETVDAAIITEFEAAL